MKYLSVCSGIEAATVAWHPLGWQAVAFGEIEKFPSQVLAHHYPDTPNWGDMTKFKEWPDADVNVFVGGTPCQSFSVAGLRKGLDDPRGNLMLTYLAIAARYRPQWLVWENVPGVLSSNGGLDFASLLRGMGELGYGFAYRILDAQYFGVAQRRRRVFVVGYLGNWRPAAAVLFERHSLSGHLAPSREKREGAAASTRASPSVGSLCARTGQSISVQDAAQGHLIKTWPAEISSTLETTFGTKQGLEDQHVNAGCPMFVPAEMSTVQTLRTKRPGEGGMSHDHEHLIPALSPALNTCSGANHAPDTKAYVVQPIPLDMMNIRGRPSDDGRANRIGRGYGEVGDPMFTITKANHHAVAQPIAFDLAQITSAANGTRAEPGLPASTISKGSDMHVAHSIGTDIYNGAITGDVAVPLTNRSDGTGTGPTVMQSVVAPTLTAANDPSRSPQSSEVTQQVYSVLQASMAVRRLTPKECERLQGFPDNYTDIKPKGKATPDGPRYKALGNSMAVPVMAWIGKRIQEVDAICQTQKQ